MAMGGHMGMAAVAASMEAVGMVMEDTDMETEVMEEVMDMDMEDIIMAKAMDMEATTKDMDMEIIIKATAMEAIKVMEATRAMDMESIMAKV